MKLIVKSRGRKSEFTPRKADTVIRIGRADDNDIALPGEKHASRYHATIGRADGGWKLLDQMSSNGTKVNGKKVNFAMLKDGDVVRIGRSTIKVAAVTPSGVSPRRRPSSRSARRRAAGHDSPGRSAAIPVAPAILAAALALTLLVGGWYAFRYYDPVGTIPAEPVSRQAGVSGAEDQVMRRIREIESGVGSALQKLDRLDQLEAGLTLPRGSVAHSRLRDARREQMLALEAEVARRANAQLAAAGADAERGLFGAAITALYEITAWLDSDPRVTEVSRLLRPRVREQIEWAEASNEMFVSGTYNRMWQMIEDEKFALALEALDALLERAWLDQDRRELYAREKRRIETMRSGLPEPDDPPPDTASDPGSILDRFRRDDEHPLESNELLPDGRASEIRLLEALHHKLVDGLGAGRVTGAIQWRGHQAVILGATGDGVRLRAASRDQQTGEILSYTTTARWGDVHPVEMLQLYDLIPDLGIEDMLAIVIFAFDHGLTDEGSRRALRVYRVRNSWKPHIDNLIAAKRRMALPAGGFVEFEDMLVAPDEREEIILQRRIRLLIERLERGVLHRDPRLRAEAEAAFDELADIGERAAPPAMRALEVLLREEFKRLEDAAGITAADPRALDELLNELDRRRAHALALIFDMQRYPYPYAPNNAEVQAEVNERVAAVREIWDNPTGYAGRTDRRIEDAFGRVQSIVELVDRLDRSGGEAARLRADVEYLQGQVNQRLTVREWPGSDRRYRALIVYNRRVLAHNRDFPTGPAHADAESRDQVRITNEYRMMFGRRAVELNDKLFWASRHHSRYCVEHHGGQIAHNIPGHPYGETPGHRAQREGYSHMIGENLHMHSFGPTAESSHRGWINSSGHHRNILHPSWRVLGSARYQTVWTQKFGAVSEGADNSVSRGGQ